MKSTNFRQIKRQKEIARKKRQDEKVQRRGGRPESGVATLRAETPVAVAASVTNDGGEPS